MSVIRIEDVAFVRFTAPELEKMHGYLQDFGMTEAAATDDALWMRGSGSAPFLHWTELGEPGFAGFGLRAASLEDLETLSAYTGQPVEPLDAPGGGSAVRLTDPDGFVIDVVAGQALAAPLPSGARQSWNIADQPTRVNSPKRVDPGPSTVLRLGHVVLVVSDIEKSWTWYRDHFGVLISDAVQDDAGANVALFMRCDRGAQPTDHHSLNFGTIPGRGAEFHHAAFEVGDLDDLMAGHELLKARGHRHRWGIGRHILGSQVFDYWSDPWGHNLEHWTDGDLFDSSDPPRVTDIATMVGAQWGPTAPPGF